MGFNQFSRPVQPVDQYLPISDEILARGAMETYNKAGQLGQKLSAYKSNLFGISTYGKDAEVLQDYENQFNQQVAELSKGDITSPQALSKFNSLVSNFSNSPDILGIHERANKYNSDLKEFKDYQKAGKPISEWRQKSLKQANDYYNGNKYLSDQRFSGTIKVDPEINKMKLDVLKSLKDEDYTTTDKNGFVHHNFGVSPERVKQALGSMIENDGQMKDYYNDLFDNEHQDLNFTDEADNIYNNLYSNYSLGATSPNPNTAASSKRNIESLEKAKQSSMYPELMKQKYKENWLNSQFDADAQAYGITTKIESKAEDAQLHAVNAQVDLQKAKNLELYKQQADLYEYMDEASKSAFEKQDFANVDMQTAAVNKRSFELAKKQAEAALLNPKVDDKNVIPGTNTSYGQLKRGLLTDDKEATQEIIPADNAPRLAEMIVNNEGISKKILSKYGLSEDEVNKAIEVLKDKNAIKDEYGKDGYTTDVEGLKIKPTGMVDKKNRDFIIPKAALSEILLELNPTGKYQESSQGTGTNTPKEAVEIPTSIKHTHSAVLGTDTIYSNNGTDWYKSDGSLVK